MENEYISASELREKLLLDQGSAREFVASLFDEGTFLETGTYIKGMSPKSYSDDGFEGVVTGCGAVDGRLVFAFVQDYSNGKGAFTSASAKKISRLYDSAIKANAPVVGLYASAGALISEGIDAVSGYGEVMAKISEAKSVIPQIAVIAGACGGASAVCAEMADFIIADSKNGELYVLPENDEKQKKGACADLYAEGCSALAKKTKELLNLLPSSSKEGTVYTLAPDDINIPSEGIECLTFGDARELISEISDRNDFFEVKADKAKEIVCGFSSINGRVVGVIANQPTENEGMLTAKAARKAARFTDFLGRFDIPLLTLVNTVGFGGESCPCYTKALAELSLAYSSCKSSKITVIVGNAFGSAFALLGSKKSGTDFVFALDSAVISVMKPESAVEFVWNDRIKEASDPSEARASLKAEWIKTAASPLTAARLGDIDDVIEYSEMKMRIAAGFEVLS